ncbi:hypothetical protein OEZ86_001244 [Tetradesmus obliquus]|nr:hypothetical protein OEZ86_001244 [Tetradesmus obliquus]
MANFTDARGLCSSRKFPWRSLLLLGVLQLACLQAAPAVVAASRHELLPVGSSRRQLQQATAEYLTSVAKTEDSEPETLFCKAADPDCLAAAQATAGPTYDFQAKTDVQDIANSETSLYRRITGTTGSKTSALGTNNTGIDPPASSIHLLEVVAPQEGAAGKAAAPAHF